MEYCGQCGAPVSGQFCGECGARTGAAPPPVDQAPTSQVSTGAAAGGWGPTPAPGPAQSPPPRKKGSGSGLPIAIAILGLVIAIAGGGYIWHLSRDDSGTSEAASTMTSVSETPAADETSASSSSTISSSSSSTSPTSPADEQEAVSMLNKLATKGEKQVPIDNKYLISLSLKWVGVTDDNVQPEPFTAVDIWNHFQTIIKDPKFQGDVKIVRDTHFGNQLPASTGGRGKSWIAVVDPNLPTAKAGLAWCKANFSERGKQLEEVCQPRKASAPHD